MATRNDTQLDLGEMRKRLQQMRQACLSRIDEDSLAERDSPDATEGPRATHDAGDEAVYESAEDDRLQDAERATQELRQIEEALLRMDEGSYGQCVDCGETIEPRRLDLVPTAERCIADQEIYDQAHLSGAHHATL